MGRENYQGRVKDTIEYRAFAGSCNLEVILTAIYMATALQTFAVNGACAYPDERIEDPVDAAKAFIAEVWKDKANRIVEDEDVEDLAATLLSQCKKAKRAFERERTQRHGD